MVRIETAPIWNFDMMTNGRRIVHVSGKIVTPIIANSIVLHERAHSKLKHHTRSIVTTKKGNDEYVFALICREIHAWNLVLRENPVLCQQIRPIAEWYLARWRVYLNICHRYKETISSRLVLDKTGIP